VVFGLIFILCLGLGLMATNLTTEKSILKLESRVLGVIGGPLSEEPAKEFNSRKTVVTNQPKLLALAENTSLTATNSALPLDSSDENQNDFFGYYITDQDSLVNQNLPLTSIRADRAGVLIYKIQKGDTLLSIASDFGISLNSIIWANNIKSENIIPGQELVILPISGVLHEVKTGQTIEEIAALYSADSQEIIYFNHLTNNVVKPGDLLIVPGGKMPATQLKTNLAIAYATSLPSYPNYYIIPTTGINWGILHPVNAVDIANRCGTPVIAAAEGLIINAEWDSGYGTYIKIQHPNSTETLYGHLSKVFVKTGDYVLAGQLIGLIGNTGKVLGVTGCHLHFEVRNAKNPFAR
jgi:murein DD-endopeptidase MepM/ murein hydrolase activator NlpD